MDVDILYAVSFVCTQPIHCPNILYVFRPQYCSSFSSLHIPGDYDSDTCTCHADTIAAATLGSFLIALLHFSIEVFVYNTVSVKSAIQPMVVASVSSLWMGAGWNYYTSYVSSAPAYVLFLKISVHIDVYNISCVTCRVSEETQVTHTDKTD